MKNNEFIDYTLTSNDYSIYDSKECVLWNSSDTNWYECAGVSSNQWLICLSGYYLLLNNDSEKAGTCKKCSL